MSEPKTIEDRLRGEIEDLKRQLAEQRKAAGAGGAMVPPRRSTLAILGLCLLVLVAAGFFAGYMPRQKRERVLAAEAQEGQQTLPVVTVVPVERAEREDSLVLPGNIQAVTEAPILARASGYIKKRYVDIGDRVQAGQVVAEIEAPELQQQVRQATAAIDQAKSNVEQAEAALQQGRTHANLAKLTADRWKNLFEKGVVSRQENDTYQAQYEAQTANVQALEKAVAASRSNAAAAEANLARLKDLVNYQTVRAPFAGVITLRNVDGGVLVNEGSTLLFRVAQTDRLRIYLNVPQADAGAVHVGQAANVEIPDLQGRKFTGTVARTANALDPSTRTLLTELQLSNAGGLLLPGMYARVDLAVHHADPPLTIPGDTLVVRADGPQVATVASDGSVHFKRIQLGRDFGDHLEVRDGLQLGQLLVVNPSDMIRDGVKVKPQKPAGKKS